MPKPQRTIVCFRCQKKRPHYCKEMCKSCYKYLQVLKATKRCKQCDRDMPGVFASGICQQCRYNAYKTRKGRAFLDKRAADERDRRQRLGDVLRERDRERNARRRNYKIAYSRNYYQQHKEELRKKHRQWRDENPATRNRRRKLYNLRKTGAEVSLTSREWEAIKDGFDHRCVYCNRKMQRLVQEHIIPVSRGGAYTQHNIVPACGSCNSRKHARDAVEFLIER